MPGPEQREKHFFRGTLYRDDLEEFFAIFAKYGGCTITQKKNKYDSPADFNNAITKKPFYEMKIWTKEDASNGFTWLEIDPTTIKVKAYCADIAQHQIFVELVEHLDGTKSFIKNPFVIVAIFTFVISIVLLPALEIQMGWHAYSWQSLCFYVLCALLSVLIFSSITSNAIYALRAIPEETFFAKYQNWIIGLLCSGIGLLQLAATLYGNFYPHK